MTTVSLAFDESGRLWVAFLKPRLPRAGWDMYLTCLDGGRWTPPQPISSSKGLDRRPALARSGLAARHGIALAGIGANLMSLGGLATHLAQIPRWGTSILEPSGTLDRGALRRIVFSEPAELEQLNSLVHPEVERMRLQLVQQARMRGDKLVVCDIPLLFERKMTEL